MSRETILIVEDETLVGLDLKEYLEHLDYFVPAVIRSGEAVVPSVARYRPDLILMDVRLDGSLDGIEAAYRTKAEFDIPVIYLTSYSDADTLRRVALTGPEAFLIKPFDKRELAANIEIALSRAKRGESPGRNLCGAASVDRLYGSDGREYGSPEMPGTMDRQERLLLETSAAEVNSRLIRLLPGKNAAGRGFLVGGFLDPCLSGSGDFYDVFSAGEHTRAFYSLDVMGHGILASFMAFSLREALPALGGAAGGLVSAPADLVRSLYARYYDRGGPGMEAGFFTIAYGTIDTVTGNYGIARAGHPPVLHVEADGSVRVHYTKGAAVGMSADAEIEEVHGRLRPGDRLLAASDGLLAAFGGRLEDSLKGLSDFARDRRRKNLGDFIEAFRGISGKSPADGSKDDSSLLVIERLP
ncbi:MAG: SpoIIE family protein phosphatase [Rectinemataceae bacterium]